MKTIEPKSIWHNGQDVNATILNASSISDNLINSATFYYSLLSDTQIQLAQGNLVMSGQDYEDWQNYSSVIGGVIEIPKEAIGSAIPKEPIGIKRERKHNDFVWEWITKKLDLTMIEDDKVVIEIPKDDEEPIVIPEE